MQHCCAHPRCTDDLGGPTSRLDARHALDCGCDRAARAWPPVTVAHSVQAATPPPPAAAAAPPHQWGGECWKQCDCEARQKMWQLPRTAFPGWLVQCHHARHTRKEIAVPKPRRRRGKTEPAVPRVECGTYAQKRFFLFCQGHPRALYTISYSVLHYLPTKRGWRRWCRPTADPLYWH